MTHTREPKYDIFISYRRKSGYDTAKHLYDLLTRDGYSVSFDIDTLRNGDFDVSLLQRIDSCTDFILIVDAHAFDRCLIPSFDRSKDWLRCELAHALQKRKNIIPILLADVEGFPENLPEDIAEVTRKNGPKHTIYYFDSFYRKLKEDFLESEPYGCSNWSYDTEKNSVNNNRNRSFYSRINGYSKHFWRYVCTALLSSILMSFGIYLRLSSNVMYLNVKGLPKDSLVAFSHSMNDVEESGIGKITYILNEIIGPDESNTVYSKIDSISMPNVSICIGENSFGKLRSIIGKKDIDVNINIEKDTNRYIAHVIIIDWQGKQYEKTIESDNVSQCIKNISAFMSLPYSPLLSVLYDYDTPKEGDEYLQKRLWNEELYNNEEREYIIKQAIETKKVSYSLCLLILAIHYENLDKMSGNYLKLAYENYERFIKSIPIDEKNKEGIEYRIKYLKGLEETSTTNVTLPEKLIEKGMLPNNPEVKQLVMVVNQKEKWIKNRKCPKATLYTFEKYDNHWKEKFPPYEVNLSIKGITSPDKKKEGDMKIPAGFYTLPYAFGYEKDINTKMTFIKLDYNHVWICDSTDDKYNQMIETTDNKYRKNPNELLKRNDHLLNML